MSRTHPSPTHSSSIGGRPVVPSRKAEWGQGQNGSSVPWYPALPCWPTGSRCSTYLFLLLVEVVDDDTDEKVQGEERPEDNEDDEVDVHVEVVFPLRLLFILRGRSQTQESGWQEWGRAAWERGYVRSEGTSPGLRVCVCVCRAGQGGQGQSSEE